MMSGELLACESFAPKDAPPPFDQIEPGGTHRNGDRVHPRVRGEPVLDGATRVTREIISDAIEVTSRVGLRHGREQGQIASGIARGRGLGEDLPILDPEGAIDPDLVGAAPILAMSLDPVPIG